MFGCRFPVKDLMILEVNVLKVGNEHGRGLQQYHGICQVNLVILRERRVYYRPFLKLDGLP